MVKIAQYQKKIEDTLLEAAAEAYEELSHRGRPFVTLTGGGKYGLRFHYLGPKNTVIYIQLERGSDTGAGDNYNPELANISTGPLGEYIKTYINSPIDFLKKLKRGITPLGAAGKTGLREKDLENILEEIKSGKTKFKKTLKRRR